MKSFIFGKIKLAYILILLIFLKFLIVFYIYNKRTLPLAADDSFAYIAQSYLHYNDFSRLGKISNSLKDFINTTVEEDTKKNHLKGSVEILRINTFLNNHYFAYTKIFGFFMKYTSIDKLKLWWIFNFLGQILILLSSYCLIKIYSNRHHIYYQSIVLFGSFFLVLSVPHHITVTPSVWSSSLLLISIYLMFYQNNKLIIKYVGLIIYFISLHFHPGAFLTACIFLSAHLINYLFNKNNKSLLIFFSLLLPIIIAISIEYFFFFSKNIRYLGLFNYNIYNQEFSVKNFIDIFIFNLPYTIKIFIKSLLPFIPFFFKYFVLVIYIYSVYLTFKKQKELFLLNIFSILSILFSCFYLLSTAHPGNIINYQLPVIMPIILITIYNMYNSLLETLKKKIQLKKSIYFLLISLIIFIPNLIKYEKMIKKRIDIQNYDDIQNKIKEFNKYDIKENNNAIIIGDLLVLYIFLSNFKDTHIYLDDKLRKSEKIWHHNNNYNVVGYIGKIDKLKKNIQKHTYVSNKKYSFNYIYIYKDFYFLYN